MPRYGNEVNFSCFLTFQILKCSIVSPRMFEQNLADLFGASMLLLLNLPEKFHYLSPKHLKLM